MPTERDYPQHAPCPATRSRHVLAIRSAARLGLVSVAFGGLLAHCGGTASSEPPAPTPPATIPEGERCTAPEPASIRLRARPDQAVLAPGHERTVEIVVEPDFCAQTALRISSSEPSVIAAPPTAMVDYGRSSVELRLAASTVGSATLSIAIARGDGTDATVELPVEVRDATPPSCSAADNQAPTLLTAGARVSGAGSLAMASIELPAGASRPNEEGFVWSVAPFDASVECAADIVPPGYRALGPAVRFGPADKRLPRELPLALPVNPAGLPDRARPSHVAIAYLGPAVPTARIVPASDVRLESVDGAWVARLSVPRLGTYQAVVRQDAGSRTEARRLSHRAVIGLSMGAAGAASLGLRRHELFDVVGALGGPVDWTWLSHHLEHHQLGGFRPIAPGTATEQIPLERAICTLETDCASDETCLGASVDPPATGRCTLMPLADEPYLHPATFNTLWSERVAAGNGDPFDRQSYAKLLRDVALAFGNFAGYNALANGENLPAGVDPAGESQTGGHPGQECTVWVEPIEGPDYEAQVAIAESCAADRCAQVQTLTGYYDDEFNPDGTFPVITFCDGSPNDEALSPYAASWSADDNGFPFETLVAVDYDGDGVRDELEPVIRAGHERWDDLGEDGLASPDEPGYGPSNLDPAGDDYDPQYNPSGTEADHRWQPGEPFDDFGLDGVAGTADSPYDFGEGDGELTLAPGLRRLWERDGHSAVRGWASEPAFDPLDDDALSRIDLWTDGGLRDPLNFAVAAQHLTGTFAARGRRVGYYGGLGALPGLAADGEATPGEVWWQDVPGTVLLRYGATDPTEADQASGSGQHLGTPDELLGRLRAALHYAGSRWPDASRALVAASEDDPAAGAEACELDGRCDFEFVSSGGRRGPVAVVLPPGYAHAARRDERFPVVFLLHGYGQSPDDLDLVTGLLGDWMADATQSHATRLPRMIAVVVDGRCRPDQGRAECIRGSFYADSPREEGAQIESWWLELMDHVDARFRTLGESIVEQPK